MAPQASLRQMPGPEYRIMQEFSAPIRFVFSWCTDFSPQDAGLEGEKYLRKVVERSRNRVIFEDLSETERGWAWMSHDVSLRPPKRWHMTGLGNNVDVVADYRLTALARDRTRLELRWRRKPKNKNAIRMTKAAREAETKTGWQNFARALERDYRRSQRR